MQHDGSFISLEKILNDYFKVIDYDPTNHDLTKKSTYKIFQILIFIHLAR